MDHSDDHRIFLTADTHFGHRRLVEEHRARPEFKTIKEMDECIIERWNAAVRPCDTVLHLGDFAFGNACYYASKLNGHIHLVKGNHDHRTRDLHKTKIAVAPDSVCVVKINDTKVVLCHYPMLSWPARGHGSLHFFGHVHSRNRLVGQRNNSYDVGVDNNNFTPVDFLTATALCQTTQAG